MAELGNGLIKRHKNWLLVLVNILLVGWLAFRVLHIHGDNPHNSYAHQPSFWRWSTQLRSSKPYLKETLQPELTLQAELIILDPLRSYLANVQIGTPPRRLSLIIDTGSDPIWTQCKPFEGCCLQRSPIFHPALSSSYANISACDAKRCSLPPNMHPPKRPQPCSSRDLCTYSLTYLDTSTSRGKLGTETVTLKSAGVSGRDDAEISIPGVVFRRGHGGKFSSADGVLGLGRGQLSFPGQIGATKFAYCLQLMKFNAPNRATSFLMIGEDSESLLAGKAGLAGLQMQYTPMVRNPRLSTAQYYVGIVKVMVGDSVEPVSPNVFGINHTDGSGGAIFDSGSTLTYLATEAYDAVIRAFRKGIAYSSAVQMNFPKLKLCFRAAAPLKRLRDLPGFRIVFENGAVLAPPVTSLFIALRRGVKCLGIADAGSMGFRGTILGNSMQQNSIMVFDNGRQRIGFAPADCAALK